MNEKKPLPLLPESQVLRARDVSSGGEATDADGTLRDRQIRLSPELLDIAQEPEGDDK